MSRVNNIIKTRRKKELIIKLVCTGVPVAENLCDELQDYMDMHKESVTKMEALYGLKGVNLTSVHHNVFISYRFAVEKDAKEFEISFIKYIKNDGTNIVESFLITDASREDDDREDFEVYLSLPETAVRALDAFPGLRSVVLEGFPTTPVYKDMVPVNNKKIGLISKDFDVPVLEIYYYSGKDKIIKTVPQGWLDIKELTYKAVINTSWATLPENIIKFSDSGVHAKTNGKEVTIPLDILKMDGQTVSLLKDREHYVNKNDNDQIFTAEMLILK